MQRRGYLGEKISYIYQLVTRLRIGRYTHRVYLNLKCEHYILCIEVNRLKSITNEPTDIQTDEFRMLNSRVRTLASCNNVINVTTQPFAMRMRNRHSHKTESR